MNKGIVCLWVALVLALPASAAEPAALELVQTITLKGPPGRFDHLALDAQANRLFIANLSNNSLDVVDLNAAKLLKQVTGQREIQGVAYVSDVNRIFVGNGMDGLCNVFDAGTFELIRSIKLDGADNVRYDPRGKRVYVAANAALFVIDPVKLEVQATIRLPGSPEAFQFDPLQPRMYVNIPNPCHVAVVDTDKNEVVTAFPLTLAEANYPLAISADGKRLFVGCRRRPSVVILDVQTGKEVGSVEIPGDVDDIFYDTKRDRLYASCGAGVLAVVQSKGGNDYELIERAKTGKLARTCLFDPRTDRLYVPVPRQEGRDAAELFVFQAAR